MLAIGVSSAVVAVLFTATGAGLVTVHVNFCAAERPPESVAVTVIAYTPPFVWLALRSIVPLITPVVALIVRPAGSPVAE